MAACRAVVDRQLNGALLGMSAFDIPRAHEAMVRSYRTLGRPGIVSCEISAADVALWDPKANLLEVPLADLLSRRREAISP